MVRLAIIIGLILFPITVSSQTTLIVSAVGYDKVYDRQTLANVTLSVNSEPGVDVIAHYSPENSNFDTWDVGIDKPILVTGIYLTGADAANYSYNTSAVSAANITPRPITGEFTAADKYYDTTTDATITGRSLIGILAGDENGVEPIGGVAYFIDPNVGIDNAVEQGGMAITGNRAFNYIFTNVASTIADIWPLQVEARFEVSNKIYDKNISATITNRNIEGLFPEDTANIKLIGGNASFDNWDAGVDKFVFGDNTFSVTGNINGNYEIVIIYTNTATIFPKPIDIMAVKDIKEYDQTTASDEIPYTVPDLLPGDFGTFWQVYDDKNVGTGKTMYPFADIIDGNNGNNYIINYVPNYEGIIESVSGIEEVPEVVSLAVYPNPGKGKFFIEIEGNLRDDIHLSIRDIRGREVFGKVYQNPVTKLAVECNLTAYPDGIYLLKLKSGSNIFHRKILKN